jgi:hypothetical protein
MINIARIARTTAAAAALAAVTVAGAPAAQAAPVQAKGFSTVQSCTSVNGKITYGKGLTKTVKTHHSVLTGTVAGCSGLNGAQSGTGTISGVLVGKSSYKSVTETGTVTVNWPAGSGLNPSNASVMLRETSKNGVITVSGTITSGAYTGARFSTSFLPVSHKGSGSKAHPLKSQTLVNTAPLVVAQNFG